MSRITAPPPPPRARIRLPEPPTLAETPRNMTTSTRQHVNTTFRSPRKFKRRFVTEAAKRDMNFGEMIETGMRVYWETHPVEE